MTGLRCPRHAATCMTSFGFETTITLAPKTFKSSHFQHLPGNDSTTPKPKRLQLKYNFHRNTPYIHPSQPKINNVPPKTPRKLYSRRTFYEKDTMGRTITFCTLDFGA